VDNQQPILDSLAIKENLAETHPRAWPASRPARAWGRSAAAEMHSSFATVCAICGMNRVLSVKLLE
jgi:glutathione S-transferase